MNFLFVFHEIQNWDQDGEKEGKAAGYCKDSWTILPYIFLIDTSLSFKSKLEERKNTTIYTKVNAVCLSSQYPSH